MRNFQCFIACALFFISKCQSINVDERDGQGFLDNVLRYYGENKSISTENLQNLLLLISARRPELVAEENPLSDLECPSVEQILSHYGFSNVSQLTMGHLERICPAVLTQVLLPSCPYTAPTSLAHVDYTGELLHPSVRCLPVYL